MYCDCDVPGSILDQVLDCCLPTPSQYLIQCCHERSAAITSVDIPTLNGNIILTKFASLAAQEGAAYITYGGAGDRNFVKITTFLFQGTYCTGCLSRNILIWQPRFPGASQVCVSSTGQWTYIGHNDGVLPKGPYPPYLRMTALRWRHNECDSVSNHQPHDCLLNRLSGRRSK